MKCKHCGFTYDEEPVCPICGTPAPVEPTCTAEAVPSFKAAQPSSSAAERQNASAAPGKTSKGLHIATLCVLSVIAFTLVTGMLMQTASLFCGLKQSASLSELRRQTEGATEPDGSAAPGAQSETVATETEYMTDDAVRKVGESFDFGKGVITLKSVTVSKEKSTFDSKKRQIAFLLQLQNNTKEPQEYEAPCMSLGSDGFDAQHFAFAEYSKDQSDGFCTIEPGKSYYAVYYYNLPKNTPDTNAQVYVFGNDSSFIAATVYSLGFEQFETEPPQEEAPAEE